MTWLDKVKERAALRENWNRAQSAQTYGPENLPTQAEKDRAKLLRLVEYVQHKNFCAFYAEFSNRACSCGLTALLESDDD